MVLYCIQHAASIIRSIIHKFKYHPQDDAVFLVDKEPSSPYCPHIDKITYRQMPDPFAVARHSADSQEETKRYTNQTISDYFREEGLDPLQFSHIYVIFDLYNPFILYFEMNSIGYMSIEFRDDFFRYHMSGDFMRQRDPRTHAYDCLIVDMHLHDAYGKNCTKAFLHSDRSVYRPLPGKASAEIFDYYKTLINLDEERKQQILKGYNIEQCDFDSVMLFNSSMFTGSACAAFGANIPSKYTQESEYGGAAYYFYKTVIDYYFSDMDFVIKPHPESEEVFMKAFSGYKQLPKEMPIELFFLFGKRFDIICPIRSSGLLIYKEHGFNITYFTPDLFVFFKHIHFIFLTFVLINAIGKPAKIPVYGIDKTQLDYFKEWAYKDFKDVEFELLDSENIKNAEYIIAAPDENFNGVINNAPEDCLIFANGNFRTDRRMFAKQEMLCSVIDLSDGTEEELQQLSWTILSKNKSLLDSVKVFSVSYTLENTKVRIESSPRT